MPLRRTLVFAASVLLMAGAAILNSRSSRRSHCLGSTQRRRRPIDAQGCGQL